MDQILADPQIQRVVKAQTENLKFQRLVQELTDQCWDSCMGYPSQKLDRKTQSCFVNCVERFIDCSTLMAKRLDTVALKEHNRGSGASDDFKWQ